MDSLMNIFHQISGNLGIPIPIVIGFFISLFIGLVIFGGFLITIELNQRRFMNKVFQNGYEFDLLKYRDLELFKNMINDLDEVGVPPEVIQLLTHISNRKSIVIELEGMEYTSGRFFGKVDLRMIINHYKDAEMKNVLLTNRRFLEWMT